MGRQVLAGQASGILVCVFLPVGTVLGQRMYVLVGDGGPDPGGAHPGVTAHPVGAWTARQGRNLLMGLGGRAGRFTFLIRGRDSRFAAAFGEVFSRDGARVIKAPVRSPRASSCAGRFAGTLRRGWLDHVLVLGERHLRTVTSPPYAPRCHGKCR